MSDTTCGYCGTTDEERAIKPCVLSIYALRCPQIQALQARVAIVSDRTLVERLRNRDELVASLQGERDWGVFALCCQAAEEIERLTELCRASLTYMREDMADKLDESYVTAPYLAHYKALLSVTGAAHAPESYQTLAAVGGLAEKYGRCPTCKQEWVIVRPGKYQPNCACDDGLPDEPPATARNPPDPAP